VFRGVGNFSLSLIGATALTIIFLSAVIYTVLDPRPILRGYLGTLPRERRAQGRARLSPAARAVIGWTEASLIVGAIEFVLVFGFLTYMGPARRPDLGGARLLRRVHPAHRRLHHGLSARGGGADPGACNRLVGRLVLPCDERAARQPGRPAHPRARP
jgi:hypothetical protein